MQHFSLGHKDSKQASLTSFPFLSWFKKIYFHVPSGSGCWLWSPLFFLFLLPFSLLLSLPNEKKSRETGLCSKQQEDFMVLIRICKLRLTKLQTSLCDKSAAWPNLNEIYKIYLYEEVIFCFVLFSTWCNLHTEVTNDTHNCFACLSSSTLKSLLTAPCKVKTCSWQSCLNFIQFQQEVSLAFLLKIHSI